jgi:hypothetical protein
MGRKLRYLTVSRRWPVAKDSKYIDLGNLGNGLKKKGGPIEPTLNSEIRE